MIVHNFIFCCSMVNTRQFNLGFLVDRSIQSHRRNISCLIRNEDQNFFRWQREADRVPGFYLELVWFARRQGYFCCVIISSDPRSKFNVVVVTSALVPTDTVVDNGLATV